MFDSKEDAQEYADELYAHDGEPDRDEHRLSPKRLTGKELLEAVCGLDMLLSPDGDLSLTHQGSQCCADPDDARVLKPHELVDRLRAAHVA